MSAEAATDANSLYGLTKLQAVSVGQISDARYRASEGSEIARRVAVCLHQEMLALAANSIKAIDHLPWKQA